MTVSVITRQECTTCKRPLCRHGALRADLRPQAYSFGDLDHSPRVIPHEYGAWVNVPAADGSWFLEDNATLHKTRPNLAACIAKAREYDCNWINFDADAEQDDSLPTFEW